MHQIWSEVAVCMRETSPAQKLALSMVFLYTHSACHTAFMRMHHLTIHIAFKQLLDHSAQSALAVIFVIVHNLEAQAPPTVTCAGHS